MADLLLYGAIKGQRDLLFPPGEGGEESVYDYSQNTSEAGSIPVSSGYPVSSSSGNAWRTAMVESWSREFDQYTQPKTNSFCCGDFYSSYYRCGANGAFCVPPGVSRVTFQLWGAGSGSAQMCCCGGAPAGINGAYALAVVDVCPGEVFCWCAGCAFCCCASMTDPGGVSGTCGTVVSYCGNPNGGDVAGGYSGAWCMCAPGANDMHMCLWNCQTCKVFPGYGTTCNLSIPSINAPQCSSSQALASSLELSDLCNRCSVQICSGCWAFCWDSAADDLYIPPIYGCRTPFTSCADAVVAKNAIFTGYPTIYPEIQISCDMQTPGFTQPAPVYGFNSPLMQDGTVGNNPNSASYQCFNGSTCAGHCSNPDAGGLCIPSLGATGSKIYGGQGATSCPGGRGRTGMICISWECD